MSVQPSVTKPKRRWASVLALSAAAFVDSSEDQTLSILWPHMRQTLGLSIGQLGPVLGISGLIRTLSLPFWGYAADHLSRKALLVGITGIWGLWTLATGFVTSLTQLMVLRVLIARSEERGIWTLQASVFPENTASLRLAQRHGFRVVGRRERLGRSMVGPLKGQWRDVLLLERRSTVVGVD